MPSRLAKARSVAVTDGGARPRKRKASAEAEAEAGSPEAEAVKLIDHLARAFPVLKRDSARIVALKQELPEYLVCAQDASCDAGLTPKEMSIEISAWWAERTARLPAWSALARQVFLLLPSSAAVERVFSILRDTFGKEQKTAGGEDLLV